MLMLNHIHLLVTVVFIIITCFCGNGEAGFARLKDVSRRFRALTFEEAYSVMWGNPSIVPADQGDAVHLKLDTAYSGSGIVSLENYMYGFYSVSLKFPVQAYSAGLVLAFYTSNVDEFPRNHDELDFEFLGNIKGQPWRMQTNIYGNGSVARGREERFHFWFDPTSDYHNYSILWNRHHIVFMVDNIPIREMVKSEDLGGDYPSKPMGMYATLWDGSTWATSAGKYKVDYKYAPYIASFKALKMQGCAADPFLENLEKEPTNPSSSSSSAFCTSSGMDSYVDPLEAEEFVSLSPQQEAAMAWVRGTYMYYSYCDDKVRRREECASQAVASPRVLRKRNQRSRKANYRNFYRASMHGSGL